MYDQEHVHVIKGRERSHNITQNDLQFIFKMNNLIKSKTKYIQNAEGTGGLCGQLAVYPPEKSKGAACIEKTTPAGPNIWILRL